MYPRLEVDYLPPRLQIGRKDVSSSGGRLPTSMVANREEECILVWR